MTTNSITHVSGNTQLHNIDTQSPESLAAGIDFSHVRPAKEDRVSKSRIKSAQGHAKRSGNFSDLKRFRRLAHESRDSLVKAAQTTCACCDHQDGIAVDCGKRIRSLPASCHNVYAAIRTGIRQGYAGVRMSGKELARWVGMPVRTVWHALRRLRALRLVTFTKNWEARNYVSVRLRRAYDRIRVENSYAPGPAAPKVASRVATPVQKSRLLAQGDPMQELQSHSLPSSGRGGQSLRSVPNQGERNSYAGRPAASEGRPNRPAVAPHGGAEGDPSNGTPPDLQREFSALWSSDDPLRALRAAENGEVAK